MSRRRLMVMGPIGAGKTALLRALGLTSCSSKTEAICFCGDAVDTPGEFFEIPRFYHTLITNSARASTVLLVADPKRPVRFPSMFVKAMRGSVIGVVTKADLASEQELDRAARALQGAGVREIYRVSSVSGQGIQDLARRLGLEGQTP